MFDKPMETGGDGIFVRLKDGDSAIGVCRGDIRRFFKVWVKGKTTEVEKGTPGARERFQVNFVTKGETGIFLAKILEGGSQIYSQLHSLHNTGYKLNQTWIRITRYGSGLNDTEYSVLPMPEHKLSEAELGVVSAVPLKALGAAADGAKTAPNGEDDVPF